MSTRPSSIATQPSLPPKPASSSDDFDKDLEVWDPSRDDSVLPQPMESDLYFNLYETKVPKIPLYKRLDPISRRAHNALDTWRKMREVDINEFWLEDHDLLSGHRNDVFDLQQSCIQVKVELWNSWRNEPRDCVGLEQQALYMARMLYRMLEECTCSCRDLIVTINMQIRHGNHKLGLQNEQKGSTTGGRGLSTGVAEEDCVIIKKEECIQNGVRWKTSGNDTQ